MTPVPAALRRQAPVRRTSRRRTPARRRKGISARVRLIVAGILVLVGIVTWGVVARWTAPRGNTSLDRFDAIIVLGTPADSEGNPRPMQLARVTEAVHEYERGVAPHLILTGGAARNRFVEARVMARVAEAQGVPASAIVVEPEAKDTVQNACYSARIMKEHGWRSAEVVASAEHLPRAGLIFNRLPLEWQAHEAPSLATESSVVQNGRAAFEVLKTIRYLLYADWAESCSP